MILINGEVQTQIAASDRGLHYGDGLFETIALVDGRPRLWPRHLARLEAGCRRLAIPMPDPVLLEQEALQLAKGQARGVVKLILTCGSGGRGYAPPAEPSPQRILLSYPWPDYPRSYWEEGVALRLCRTPLACNPVLAGVKHLNRLEQVLARAEWDDPAIAEGLMCNLEGQVIEGTMSNLFLIRDGRVYTPDLDRCGVAGVMRGVLLELLEAQGIPCEVTALTLDEVRQADELLLSNSLIGLWPVCRFEEREFFAPGPIGRRLGELLQQHLEAAHA